MPLTRREHVLAEIGRLRLCATMRAKDAEIACDAMRAAVAGGFRMIEFTLNTPGALELIRAYADGGDLLVGAGTVLSPAQAADAVAAGAQFVVSPVCDPEVIAAAAELDVVSIPGTFTPTEMLTAHRCGADLVKLFPGPADPAAYVAAVLGPLPWLRIFPTSGTTPDNFLDILRAGAFGAAFVKSLFEPAEMARRDYAAIERRAAGIMERFGAS